MTETRWTKIGTFTTQSEADELLAILVAAQIPYSQSGVLGPHRTGSIEFHVPNEFVDAAKAAIAQARDRPSRAPAPPTAANVVDAADQAALDAGIAHGQNRRRNFARVMIAALAILCFVGAFAQRTMAERNWTTVVVMLVLGTTLLVALAASFRRRGTT
ncbi:MAG: hypothetical protein IPH13_04770 [Planctomycetes bacterium]|nr:hypothetical protein [Planctomycetota bacterium]MCC7168885.1 hypothetical protein [Planctomycetota bacterium]